MNNRIRTNHRSDSEHRLLSWSLAFGLACILSGCQAAPSEPSAFEWVGDGVEGLQLQEQGKDVLFFQLAPKSLEGAYPRANYVHPLYDVAGDIVTEDFPEDHRHHRGIFWAWHQLMLNGEQVADPWSCENIEWKEPQEAGEWVQTETHTESAKMRVVRNWLVPRPSHPDESIEILRETVSLKVLPARDGVRIIDFDLRFRALREGVALGGSDDAKGYGGFSPRIRLSDDTKFNGQVGETEPERNAVDAGKWMNVTRTLDGKMKGVAILVHPSHPDPSSKWILRPTRSMQNLQWPGQAPTPLSTHSDTRLRYRLVLHSGELDHERLERLWNEFASH